MFKEHFLPLAIIIQSISIIICLAGICYTISRKRLAPQKKFERVATGRLVRGRSDETPSASLWYSNIENNPIYPICSWWINHQTADFSLLDPTSAMETETHIEPSFEINQVIIFQYHVHTKTRVYGERYYPWKLTWQWKIHHFEDVFPIENGDFPMSC